MVLSGIRSSIPDRARRFVSCPQLPVASRTALSPGHETHSHHKVLRLSLHGAMPYAHMAWCEGLNTGAVLLFGVSARHGLSSGDRWGKRTPSKGVAAKLLQVVAGTGQKGRPPA